MDNANLPPYINRDSRQVLRGPLSLNGVKIDAFLLPADIAALQAQCDRFLNAASDGSVRYKPLIPFVVLMAARIAQIRSKNPNDARIGWIPETDVAFWIPVAVYEGANAASPTRVAWFIPYIWVDNAMAIATGREIFGYPKEQGFLEVDAAERGLNGLTVTAFVFPTFSPETEVRKLPLIEIKRLDPPGHDVIRNIWNDVVDGFRDITELVRGGIFCEGGIEFMESAIAAIRTGGFTNVYLKEFRDAEHEDRACYRSIIEAPAKVTRFGSGSLLQGDFQVRIHPYESHPIVRDLGLSGETIRAAATWTLDFDFDLDMGREVG